jgi:putative endonuclease
VSPSRTTLSERERRKRSERQGRWAEQAAEWWLRLKGYSILDRRYRTPLGEIDLVARRGRRLAFVEVKLRPTHDEAIEAITPQLRDRVSAAADLWQQRHDREGTLEPAFDVVVVTPGRWPCHLRDAFPFD